MLLTTGRADVRPVQFLGPGIRMLSDQIQHPYTLAFLYVITNPGESNGHSGYDQAISPAAHSDNILGLVWNGLDGLPEFVDAPARQDISFGNS